MKDGISSFFYLRITLVLGLAKYIGESIEQGIARDISSGFEWSFRLNKEIPGAIANMRTDAIRTIAERPAFHGLTTDGTPMAGSFHGVGGGFCLRSKRAFKQLSDAEFSVLYPPTNLNDINIDSFWGVCPESPKSYAAQHADICAVLYRNLRNDQFFFNNETFYYKYKPEERFWLRVATIEALGFAIDMPVYFLGQSPAPSNPVMLSDPQHTVVEDELPFSEFEKWIKDSLQKVEESQD